MPRTTLFHGYGECDGTIPMRGVRTAASMSVEEGARGRVELLGEVTNVMSEALGQPATALRA